MAVESEIMYRYMIQYFYFTQIDSVRYSALSGFKIDLLPLFICFKDGDRLSNKISNQEAMVKLEIPM